MHCSQLRNRTLVSGAFLALIFAATLATACNQDEKAQTSPAAASQPAAPRAAAAPATQGFTGRWRLGPRKAPIRIVMFADYQCSLCKAVEAEAMRIVETRKDVSLSIKYFPMCPDCNPGAPNMHPNACWASRAAEAAGILKGEEGFWRMHKWLFAHDGSFTDDNFPPAVRELGFDWDQFKSVMSGEETLSRLKADIAEATDLGLFFTPMVFINGVEMRGVTAQTQRLGDAVAIVTRMNPPAADPELDQPEHAEAKYVGDWRESPLVPIPPTPTKRSRGPEKGAVRVVVFGDYEVPHTKELWPALLEYTKEMPNVHVEFRFFPFNKDCNSGVKVPSKYAFACLTAQCAAAAELLGGPEAFWRVHDLLLSTAPNFGEPVWQQAAQLCGVSVDELKQKMSSAEVKAVIDADIKAGTMMHLGGVPAIYVNQRLIPRWRMEGAKHPILRQVLEEAAKGAK